MNFQQLRYCQALAQTASFVRAAQICNVTQPTLSNGVAQLELELGSPIFARTTRTVSLTSFGESILASLLDVLNAQAAVFAKAKELADPDQQVIRIGISPLINSNLTESLIAAFKQNHRSNIILREMNLVDMKGLLDIGQLDFVFGPTALNTTDLTIQKTFLYRETLVFLPNQKATGSKSFQKEVTLSEIASETFLMVPDSCGLSAHTRSLFASNNLSLSIYPGNALSYTVLQDWAKIGMGAVILPISKLHPDAPKIAILGEDSAPVRIEYYALWHDRNPMNAASTAFCSFLADIAQEIISGLGSLH